jgi:ABC-type antimicrobial peptide transport system permease subunit
MNRVIPMLVLIGIGGFFGLMIPGIGGLIYPPMLAKAGGPFITSTTDKIVLEKEGYSYKPGQSGTAYHFLKVSTDGRKEEVTFELLGYSIAVYSVICTLVLLVFYSVYKLARKKPSRAGGVVDE